MSKQYRIINKGKGSLDGLTSQDLFKVGRETTDAFFPFAQNLPSDTWAVVHTLNKFPSVSVVDTSGNVVVGDIRYIDNFNLIITFSAPFAGKAYLN